MGKVCDLEAIFPATIEQFGRLDMLINNAGISPIKPLEDITEAECDRQDTTNVKGTSFAGQLAARHLRASSTSPPLIDWKSRGHHQSHPVSGQPEAAWMTGQMIIWSETSNIWNEEEEE